jgi:hypothetical protein
VARGFDSKSVADQQEEAFGRHRSEGAPLEEPAVAQRRRSLELARADVRQRLEAARSDGHREMLRRALEAIEAELGQLGPAPHPPA